MNQDARVPRNMPQKQDTVRDPVCGMKVAQDQHVITYQQIVFAFCSIQCKERFVANPRLYIGHPGYRAPAQEGRTVLKHRRMKLDEALPDDLAKRVIAYISEMMGIGHTEIKGDTIDIQYDLVQVTEAQIESALAEVGATLGHSWSEQLRRGFVHYLEETEISSLEVPSETDGHHH